MALPVEMRGELKQPLGELWRGEVECNVQRLKALAQGAPQLATVGDFVSIHAWRGGLRPHVTVIDFRVMRSEVEPYRLNHRELRVSNPPGRITAEAQEALHRVVNGPEPCIVVVEGEEDLLVLPLITYMPLGSLIVYGQPREGMVVVGVTEERKAWAHGFMGRMARGGCLDNP